MQFYLTNYVGSGTSINDPFRPDGTDGIDGWSSIDLRDYGINRVLLALPDGSPDPATGTRLGTNLDTVLTPQQRTFLQNQTGKTFPAGTTVRQAIRILLLRNGTLSYMRETDGKARIWLGQLVTEEAV